MRYKVISVVAMIFIVRQALGADSPSELLVVHREIEVDEDKVTALACSPDGTRVAVAGTAIHVIDLKSGKRLHGFEGKSKVQCLAWSADGEFLAAANEKRVEVWDTRKGTRSRELLCPSDVYTLGWSPDGARLAIGTRTLQLWEVKQERAEDFKLEGKHGVVQQIHWSADGKQLTVLCADRSLRELDLVKRREIARRHNVGIRAAFATMHAGLLEPGTIKLTDPRFPHREWLCKCGSPHRGWAWSQDLLITADHALRAWDTCSGKPIAVLEPKSPVSHLVGVPDGTKVITASTKTITVWRVNTSADEALEARELDRLWSALGDPGIEGYRAMARLRSNPRQAMPFLQERLKNQPEVDAKQIERLIVNLDSERYEVRLKARAELAALGAVAVPYLRDVANGEHSLEVKRAAEKLLANCPPPSLTILRALSALEGMGTEQSRSVLKELAQASHRLIASEAMARIERTGVLK